ncbi:LLM class flavin-dependent oxidoreductase [Pedococcus sp. 5OH_020]|uniref:LLM class flavin-dependent oxidoreductase n=1 Tax=Pedococcus sp. 5OH_020 TaxID=2989814 RepID=UPI0022E9D756|nr:LLM class flavin-dependent oxidoreductase [Pedococcus sp. 5OH_020]
MRFGIVILPEHRWADAAPLWRRAEEYGFDHAWTYDHLVWAGLPDSSWFGALPTLTAAAGVTSGIRLGTFVSSPNYRHPYPFVRDLLALDDICGGRLVCGLGTGGDLDSGILGEQWSVKERVARFQEFVELLDRLLREDHVHHVGTYYRTVDARTLPGSTWMSDTAQRPRVPFVVAANGPRALRLAAAFGQGWVTYGRGGESFEDWWGGVSQLSRQLDDIEAGAGRDAPLDRYLSLDGGPRFSLESAELFEEMTGRAAELGFTDVVTHWPRRDGPYAGRAEVLDEVASRLPGLA